MLQLSSAACLVAATPLAVAWLVVSAALLFVGVAYPLAQPLLFVIARGALTTEWTSDGVAGVAGACASGAGGAAVAWATGAVDGSTLGTRVWGTAQRTCHASTSVGGALPMLSLALSLVYACCIAGLAALAPSVSRFQAARLDLAGSETRPFADRVPNRDY